MTIYYIFTLFVALLSTFILYDIAMGTVGLQTFVYLFFAFFITGFVLWDVIYD